MVGKSSGGKGGGRGVHGGGGGGDGQDSSPAGWCLAEIDLGGGARTQAQRDPAAGMVSFYPLSPSVTPFRILVPGRENPIGMIRDKCSLLGQERASGQECIKWEPCSFPEHNLGASLRCSASYWQYYKSSEKGDSGETSQMKRGSSWTFKDG